ncbi:MAG: hypothetical protein FWC32_11945 [Firmicutes bacterium]|nr:hypothetical protein [Bacillota bacterium]
MKYQQEHVFRERITCAKAEIAMLSHMEGTLSSEDAQILAQHVEKCELCREYYLAFDEVMEYAASDEADWQEAPANFTATVMAEVNKMSLYTKPAVEAIRRKGMATLHILWGVSAILLGVALFFAFNPQHLATLTSSYPIFDNIAVFLAGAATPLDQVLYSTMQNHTIESSLGIAALLFVLILGSLLVVLHKQQEETVR